MRRSAEVWRRLRQLSQFLGVLLFLAIFVFATYLSPRRAWADLLYHLDPLIALTASLAGRRWVGGFGLAFVTVVITLLFGRVWCGWFCPLGTVLGWLSPKRGRWDRRKPDDGWRA
ncbi:MAG: 4Fe-4S binding protein, partial [Anaerolineae bacterium]|nr:4Fe-4S binding protein [Anaerolineae bacterium]